MNINAKQMNSIDVHNGMDNTTCLGFLLQIMNIVAPNGQLVAILAAVWSNFVNAFNAFDDAFAQARKWMQTGDIKSLDELRDAALSAFLNMLKAMQASPNQEKQSAAKYLMFIREKYNINPSDEYMKETTAVGQLIQELESNQQAQAALQTTGLNEWFLDLKAKNDAFLEKMNERTADQAGLQKGIVRNTRIACEAAYRNVVKLINALSIVEYPADMDYNTPIDLLNAEIEHYRLILARKGVSTGSGGNSGSSTNSGTGSNQNQTENSGNGNENQNQGGGTNENQGGGTGDNTPSPTPTPTPDSGGDNTGTVTPTPDPDPTPGGGGQTDDGTDES